MARARRKTSKRPPAAARRPAGKQVRPVPAGYRTVTAYLTVNDAARALEFYARAFGARETQRMPGPGGKIMHAELRIGDSIVMLSDEFPGLSSCKSPTTLGGTTGSLFLYVADVDAAFKQAVAAGCTVIMPLTNMFWGDRFGKLQDPFGNQWSLASHKEDVSPAEMGKRAHDAMARMAPPHGAS